MNLAPMITTLKESIQNPPALPLLIAAIPIILVVGPSCPSYLPFIVVLLSGHILTVSWITVVAARLSILGCVRLPLTNSIPHLVSCSRVATTVVEEYYLVFLLLFLSQYHTKSPFR